jgi:hypothetical protein
MTMTHLRSAWWLPLFDELADPLAVARLAAQAEEAGGTAVRLGPRELAGAVRQVADRWIPRATHRAHIPRRSAVSHCQPGTVQPPSV